MTEWLVIAAFLGAACGFWWSLRSFGRWLGPVLNKYEQVIKSNVGRLLAPIFEKYGPAFKGILGNWGIAALRKFNREKLNQRPSVGDCNSLRWFDVFEISVGASQDEIKRSFREKITQYHPDKVAHLGIELRALAEKKSKEILAAYNEAMRSRRPLETDKRKI